MSRLRHLIFLAICFFFADVAAAQDMDGPNIEAEVTDAKEVCEGLGTFEFDAARVMKEVPDLNGDSRADFLADHSGFLCHGAYSIYGGSAGSPLTVFISGPEGFSRFRFQARAWRVVEWSGEDGAAVVLLLSHHGTICGGAGSAPCYSAYAWQGNRLFFPQ